MNRQYHANSRIESFHDITWEFDRLDDIIILDCTNLPLGMFNQLKMLQFPESETCLNWQEASQALCYALNRLDVYRFSDATVDGLTIKVRYDDLRYKRLEHVQAIREFLESKATGIAIGKPFRTQQAA